MKKNLFIFEHINKIFHVLLMLFAFSPAHAQSTSELVARLENQLQSISSEFAVRLRDSYENPELILLQDMKAAASTTLGALDSLGSEIDAATEIVNKKEASIASGSLPKDDKKELITMLGKEKKTLSNFREKIAQVRRKVHEIENKDLEKWRQTFTAFETIKGKESAREKLLALMKSSLKSVPLLAEPFANPPARPVSSPTPNPTSKAQPQWAEKIGDAVSISGVKLNPFAEKPTASPTQSPSAAKKSSSPPEADTTIDVSETGAWTILIVLAITGLLWIVFLFKAGSNSTGPGSLGNIFCAFNSLLFPGLGQIGQRRFISGILFIVSSMFLWAFYMGWVMHIWATMNAAMWKKPVSPPPLPEQL